MHGAGAAAAAAIANAIKAFGIIVQVDVAEFFAILKHAEHPLIVAGKGGMFRKHHAYLMSYGGFVFYTKSSDALVLPRHAVLVTASKVSIPDF